jgi:hypothetical protein
MGVARLSSKAVHQTLGRAFSEAREQAGFQRARSSICCYVKPARTLPETNLVVRVQCHSFGGLLTIEAGAGPSGPSDAGGYLYRLLCYCTESEAVEANQIREYLVRRKSNLLNVGAKWEPGKDNWCPYDSIDDVLQWGEFLAPLLTSLVARHLQTAGFPLSEFFDLSGQT